MLMKKKSEDDANNGEAIPLIFFGRAREYLVALIHALCLSSLEEKGLGGKKPTKKHIIACRESTITTNIYIYIYTIIGGNR
jgi:predicted nucleic acid-binding Zn finger protein